jgi:hypothetical protein
MIFLYETISDSEMIWQWDFLPNNKFSAGVLNRLQIYSESGEWGGVHSCLHLLEDGGVMCRSRAPLWFEIPVQLQMDNPPRRQQISMYEGR